MSPSKNMYGQSNRKDQRRCIYLNEIRHEYLVADVTFRLMSHPTSIFRHLQIQGWFFLDLSSVQNLRASCS